MYRNHKRFDHGDAKKNRRKVVGMAVIMQVLLTDSIRGKSNG